MGLRSWRGADIRSLPEVTAPPRRQPSHYPVSFAYTMSAHSPALLNVVLIEPEIPPNTGNIGRLCLAAGCRLHLVEPLGFSIDDRSLLRAGLDYWKEVDCRRWPDFTALQSTAGPEARFFFFTTKTRRSYWDATFHRGDYLVFGRETRGLPESVLREHKESCVTIPQQGARSLNLATAAGIAVYEALRQIGHPPQ